MLKFDSYKSGFVLKFWLIIKNGIIRSVYILNNYFIFILGYRYFVGLLFVRKFMYFVCLLD